MNSERETGAGAVTWEMQALKQIEADVSISLGTYLNLMSKGLVEREYLPEGGNAYAKLTDAGRAVLASASEPAAVTEAAQAGDEIPDTFDIDGFQHAIIDMDGDLIMGRMIESSRVRNAEKAHDEIVAALRARVADLEAENGRLKAEVHKAETREKMADHMADVYKEQYAQSRENAQLLYSTLNHVARPELKKIEDQLWQSTNEYDKLMSEGRKWKLKYQQEIWKQEAAALRKPDNEEVG